MRPWGFTALPGHPKTQAAAAVPPPKGLWASVRWRKVIWDQLVYCAERLVLGSQTCLGAGTDWSSSLAQHRCRTAQHHAWYGTQAPSSLASHAAKLHWPLWWRQRKGNACTNKTDKHVLLNRILLYSYFCLHLSLMLRLVWFWCSLLSSHASFPNTSNQFYNSAEGYLVYLLARIEQQLIIGLLFCKLHSSVAGQEGFKSTAHRLLDGTWWDLCWRAPGKAEFSSGDKSHTWASASPAQSSD